MTATIMTQDIRKLPLHNTHVQLGGKMGAFGEWEVPLYYSSILEEHAAVREKCGIFDISHMGEVWFRGSNARKALNSLLPGKIEKLVPGKAVYSPMLNERGGIVDDLIVSQIDADSYLVVVNAANVEKDYNWFLAHNPLKAEIVNESDAFGLLAVQGPESAKVVSQVFSDDILKLPYYHIQKSDIPWKGSYISRTGYTGEIGFEIFLAQKNLKPAYNTFLEIGKSFGIKPIGFGARDTLRLESCMLLYGQDMNDDTSPLEAGLEWTLDLEKDFVGKDPLVKLKTQGIAKKLVGFEMIDRGLARHDYSVFKNGKIIGKVTSGTFAPTLKKNIGLAYVDTPESAVGNEIQIQIRDQQAKARIVKTPFYKKNTTKEIV